MVTPVLAGLDTVDVHLTRPAGMIKVHLDIQEHSGAGEIKSAMPLGFLAEVFAS
jgi:hypothetical protein